MNSPRARQSMEADEVLSHLVELRKLAGSSGLVVLTLVGGHLLREDVRYEKSEKGVYA